MKAGKNSAKEKLTVLHVTPHLGGGVGKVMLNYLEGVKNDPDFSHRVISLEYANERALAASRTVGFPLLDRMASDHDGVLSEMARADIVLVHWWNHPLLFAFLVRETLPPVRIIFWSHISGFHAPYVFTGPALRYPDLFVFTSPLSLETPEAAALDEGRRQALRVVWSTGGIDQALAVTPRTHPGFNIGYIGTVDYGKLHPDFITMSAMTDIPDATFVVCGGPNEDFIRREAQQAGVAGRFNFTGQVTDIAQYLAGFDVFGYPLAPYHYGTCEQSLGESMAAGVPPVVLANRTEKCIVQDGVNGLVAAGAREYARAIEELYRNPGLRRRLSENARKHAAGMYSLESMICRWSRIFEEALGIGKTARHWSGRFRGGSILPHEVFIESLGSHAREFLASRNARSEKDRKKADEDIIRLYESSNIWRAGTRGTPNHYHAFYPDNDFLKRWSDLSR